MHIEPAVSDSRPTCKRSTLDDRSLAAKQRDDGWRRQKGLVDKYHRLFADHAGAALAGTGEPISRSSISVLKPASNQPVEHKVKRYLGNIPSRITARSLS
ncbi:hypothetical protein [Bradyrhizobium sp. Leo121]|uniref:hypothetical protein n=1 Tax=Bradyrhizobium sp. Leo121 TaxID=1571195 RepID=UPI001028A8D7|nr:hypothetical protein [Bradyrhizobium sp. Leo121]RZN11417.1 hypothetical protein CWO90_46455 [Bradyrhizobium sp. Leo121]